MVVKCGSESTIKKPKRPQRRSDVCIVNFEHIKHLFDFEQVNVCWKLTWTQVFSRIKRFMKA